MATLALSNRRPVTAPARWVPWTTTLLSLLALADSCYLMYLHLFNQPPPFCPTKGGFIDCESVITSKWSHPLGIPVVYPGVAWSLAMVVLCSPWGWGLAYRWATRARLGLAAAGVLMVFYLLWAEFIELHHLCEYCTAMHIITLALFFVIVFSTAMATPPEGGEAYAEGSA